MKQGDPRDTTHPHGASDISYHDGRLTKRQLIYRLRRRSDEVSSALRRYGGDSLGVVVDVGTADGLMFDVLRERLCQFTFVGIDVSRELLLANSQSYVSKVLGDALNLPVASESADAVIGTAIIEHVLDPVRMMEECARVLRPEGLMVLTTPDPFMERMASRFSIHKESGHHRTLTLNLDVPDRLNHGLPILCQ
jgi:ubiquinone/menaquinone biosynthesis C-methylase UbiE